jgi:hypothetical protein
MTHNTEQHPTFLASSLGYLGLLPFILPTVLLVYDAPHTALWLHFLMTYAAVILSFVGALHWAFAMTLADLTFNQKRWGLLWSIIPALVAWLALFLASFDGMLVMAAFFAGNFMQDAYLAKVVGMPSWYMRLRFHLSFVAASCLILAAALIL